MTVAWTKIQIQIENEEYVNAQAPLIISASRSTDIPAFYSSWFFQRLKIGYSAWTNPFNGKKSYVSYKDTRLIVFWSKNPQPLLEHIDYLKSQNINCYIQYTLNDYELEGFEKGVPSLQKRIETFKRLVDRLGVGSVIWRFDPLILTDTVTIEHLLQRIENIGNQLQEHTEKMVFSFVDIESYRKVKNNLFKIGHNCREFTDLEIYSFAEQLSELNKRSWNYTLGTCGETINLNKYGINHNKCIDDQLIASLFKHDTVLLDFLGIQSSLFGDISNKQNKTKLKDSGQREACGCIKSKDIGEYNTCPHLCEYCYANNSKEIAKRNYMAHKQVPNSETITGK